MQRCWLHAAPRLRRTLPIQSTPRSFYSTAVLQQKAEDDDDAIDNDYYHIFDIPRSFLIDEKLLQDRYRALMKEVHPDQNPNDNHRAATVTHAYDVLKRPSQRARHLLELLGAPLTEDDNQSVAPRFLMEIMDVRERIDDCSDTSVLQREHQHNVLRLEEWSQKLQRALESDDVETVRELAGELQYLYRIDETLRERLD